jgi:hypothetical protein
MDQKVAVGFCLAFTLGLFSIVSCSSGESDILSLFDGIIEDVSPCDSLDLSQLGINDPVDILKYGDCYIIEKGLSGNKIDIVTRDSVIHCFKRGRGPGEVLMASEIQQQDKSLFLYDISAMRLWELDLEGSIASGRQVADVFKQYSGMSNDVDALNRPFHLLVTPGRKIVASGIFANDCWYGYLEDNCAISGRVDYVRSPDTKSLSDKQLAVFHTSNTMAISPGGGRIVAALKGMGALSISQLGSGAITEQVRKIYYEPEVSAPGDKNLPTLMWSPDSKTGFCALKCTEKIIYALYSGRARDSSIPTSECQWLLAMDWNANPVKAFRLGRTINSFCLDGDRIVGVSMYPESRLYIFPVE